MFQKGVNVEVLHGTLKGIIGEVVSICGQTRLVMRIDSMNCSLYANISREEVKLLEDKPEKKSFILA